MGEMAQLITDRTAVVGIDEDWLTALA